MDSERDRGRGREQWKAGVAPPEIDPDSNGAGEAGLGNDKGCALRTTA